MRNRFFGKGGVDDILAEEQRQQMSRYERGESKLKELGIKMSEMHKVLESYERNNSNGNEIVTNDMAVGIYIYSKQPDAKEKLLSGLGNGFTQAELDDIIDKLPQKFKDWGDYLIEDMKSQYDRLAEVYYNVKGKRLGYVADYFPLMRGAEDARFEDVIEGKYFEEHKGPDGRMVYKRIGGYYPLALDATNVWYRMVHKQEHYIAAAEWVSDTQKMLDKSGGDVYGTVKMMYGDYYAKGLQNFLDRFAHKSHVYDTTSNFFNHMRSNLTVARLGFNVLTAMKQIPSLGYFVMKFGPIRLMTSIGDLMFNWKGTTEEIYRMSPQLKNRNFSYDMELVQNLKAQNRWQRGVKSVGRVGMLPIKAMDKLVVNTLWWGTYQSNLAKNMTPEDAARDATRFIGDTQPGGSVVDSAAIYSTDQQWVKFLLMFSSQLNKNFNMIWHDIPYALRHKQYKQAITTTMGLGLAFTGILYASGLMGLDDDDDDKSLITKYLSQIVNAIPALGPSLSSIMLSQYYNGSDQLVLPEIDALFKAITSEDEDRINKALVRFGLSVAELQGLPSGLGTKVYNSNFKEDDINLGYMLNNNFGEYFE